MTVIFAELRKACENITAYFMDIENVLFLGS
jgi:hypothetical protein